MGCGEGGGGCNLGVILVRVCVPVFKNLPHSFTWPLKKRTHSYTWSSKMLTYSYTALWFFVPIYCWLVDKYHSHFMKYQEDKQPRKTSERKICAYTRMSEKWAFHIGIQKNQAIHILFVEKRGPIIYLAALKRGAIRHAHPYYAIYRKLSPLTRGCLLYNNLMSLIYELIRSTTFSRTTNIIYASIKGKGSLQSLYS